VPYPDPGLAARAASQDLHPTGPLWGDGPRPVEALAAEIEDRALEGAREWCTALEDVGLRQERRALRVRIADPFWKWEAQPSTLVLAFGLPAGAYATVVLAELLEEEDEEPREHEGTGTRA
jgi:tRNA pseudouridine13 synthase